MWGVPHGGGARDFVDYLMVRVVDRNGAEVREMAAHDTEHVGLGRGLFTARRGARSGRATDSSRNQFEGIGRIGH